MESLLLPRFGPRARSTSLGIALCTMFVVASFGIADSLGSSTEGLAGSFSSEYSLITRQGAHGLAEFMSTDLPSEGRFALGILAEATVSETSSTAFVFSVVDADRVLREVLSPPENGVLVGQGGIYPETLTISSVTTSTVPVSGTYSSTMFPTGWILGSEPLLRQLSGLREAFNFAVGRDMSGATASALAADGFVVQPLIGIIEFLDSGIDEIRSDALWILLPSGFVIAVLSYSFMGSEISDRRHDIGILKTVGAGRRRVLAILAVNAAAISAWGGLLGLALGIVATYGTSTIASSMFTSAFVIRASGELLAYSFIVTVCAAVAGAFLPALRMTLSNPVDDLKEAMSSY